MSTLREMIAVMQAAESGKKIQCRYWADPDGPWMDTDSVSWSWADFDYRVKPEPELPPGEITAEEAAELMDIGKSVQCDFNDGDGFVELYLAPSTLFGHSYRYRRGPCKPGNLTTTEAAKLFEDGALLQVYLRGGWEDLSSHPTRWDDCAVAFRRKGDLTAEEAKSLSKSGVQVQCFFHGKWVSASELFPSGFAFRRKLNVMVPLDLSDWSGSRVWWIRRIPDSEWMVLFRSTYGVGVSSSNEPMALIPHRRLMDEKWERTTDGVIWSPCSKEVES